jgi:hypothetical protein
MTQSGLQPIAPRELKNTPVPRQSVVASPPHCRGEHAPLTSRKDDAVAEAKQSIDRILNLDSSFT